MQEIKAQTPLKILKNNKIIDNLNTSEEEWAEHFLEIAQVVKKRSKDKSTQIGAVLVGPGREIISTGYNSFPRGIDDNVDARQERPEKYYWMEHGERNAIYNAARIGIPTTEATMYLTCSIPCADCARGIINAGIREIWVTSLTPRKDPNKPWAESGARSIVMFEEAQVRVRGYASNS